VPLVEAGLTESEEALAASREYLTFLARLQCRTVILGCTHYPYLLPVLRRAAAELFEQPVTFIDPAHETAAQVPESVEANHLPAERSLLLTTGNADNFASQAPALLRDADFDIGSARWENGVLVQSNE
jgi:glutamate racemase